MSDAISPSIESSAVVETGTAALQKPAGWFSLLESRLEWLGEFANPILVKETRQALKSRQFTVTFILLLVACWIISIGGVALTGPAIYYVAAGPILLRAYFAVLAFPLAVVVPYAAFRSLAAERDENTYDLLTVSTLTPQQIIAGKLATSVVQMGVYLSVVAPCLAFTYLLRGLDVVSVSLLLTYAILGSLGLSMLGLLFAAASKNKHGHVLMSVLLVVQLLAAFSFAISIAEAFLQSAGQMIGEWGFWAGNAFLLTAYVTTMALCYFAASGMITYSSANRSTPLRWCMLVQTACAVGWVAVGLAVGPEPELIEFPAVAIAAYWAVAGILLVAEPPVVSQRVRRTLPESQLGRNFLTWLSPGPSTGLVFALTNLGATLLASAIGALVIGSSRSSFGSIDWTSWCILCWCYVAFYLGIGRLLISMLRRYTTVTYLAAVLIQCLVVLACSAGPALLQTSFRAWRNLGYTLMQVSNPFWTLSEVLDSGGNTYLPVLLLVVPAATAVILLLNLPDVVREMRQERAPLPPRLQAEIDRIAAATVRKPQSPWDEPTAVLVE